MYPGMLSAIIELINPPYFFVMAVEITDSPGDNIAGTTSPAPFGPGTETIPFEKPGTTFLCISRMDCQSALCPASSLASIASYGNTSCPESLKELIVFFNFGIADLISFNTNDSNS